MNIRPRAGETVSRKPSIPQLRPVSQDLKLAVGMFVPALDWCGLGQTEEHPSYA
jgi:hypothetical protein